MIKGNIHKFGANIDTDAIIPSPYANLIVPEELGAHCMEGIDPKFSKAVQPGDIIMATTNFGCGSSREIAPISIKGAGVACVIAENFARIFYRNGINIALPLLECPEAVKDTESGDEVEVELSAGRIINHTKGKEYQAVAYPEFLKKIMDAGGLIPYTKTKSKR